jgi:chromate reductase, NAD(P)H dehydrogenase (quinone)
MGYCKEHDNSLDVVMTTTILGIAGSLRQGSLNRGLLRAADRVLPDDTKLEVAHISDLPIYNWDVEQEHGFPEPVRRFRDQIVAADALLIATPEYNNSIPGALKNAIDWASRGGLESPMTRMPAAIMGAAGRLGSVRAQMHLRTILQHNDLQVVQKPEVLVAGRASFEDGELVDERYLDQIRRLLAALLELV